MNIGIKEITRGRFGNRVFHYNNLAQICNTYNVEGFCDTWEGHEWFENLLPSFSPSISLPSLRISDFKQNLYIDLINNSQGFTINGLVIHNLFFELTKQNPKNFLKLKKEYLPNFENSEKILGIHIRGGDILTCDNQREVHTFEYYQKAVFEVCEDSKIDRVFICTDDMSFPLVHQVFEFCKNHFENDKVKFGPSTENTNLPHIYDFAILSESDYLIGGSSTYVAAANIVGKEKKLIHSTEWLKRNLPGDTYFNWGRYTSEYPESYWKSFDSFWIEIYNGGNEFYKTWKIV